jgi:hypothetical protein
VHQEDVLVDQWWLGYAQRCPEKLPRKPFLKDTENKITLKEKKNVAKRSPKSPCKTILSHLTAPTCFRRSSWRLPSPCPERSPPNNPSHRASTPAPERSLPSRPIVGRPPPAPEQSPPSRRLVPQPSGSPSGASTIRIRPPLAPPTCACTVEIHRQVLSILRLRQGRYSYDSPPRSPDSLPAFFYLEEVPSTLQAPSAAKFY